MLAREALGVRSPSLLFASSAAGGVLTALAPPAEPWVGEDWKNRGDDAGGWDERGARRGVPEARLPRPRRGDDIVNCV